MNSDNSDLEIKHASAEGTPLTPAETGRKPKPVPVVRNVPGAPLKPGQRDHGEARHLAQRLKERRLRAEYALARKETGSLDYPTCKTCQHKHRPDSRHRAAEVRAFALKHRITVDEAFRTMTGQQQLTRTPTRSALARASAL